MIFDFLKKLAPIAGWLAAIAAALVCVSKIPHP